MRILIIEDEDLAAEGLLRQIKRVLPEFLHLDTLDTVKAAVQWFRDRTPPDLAFMDIQLADGLSFEIFEQVSVACPVIFTTAYDAYALRAFKVNSVDYLLKPVEEAALKQALEKLERLRSSASTPATPQLNMDLIRQLLDRNSPQYKTRFMVKVGERLMAHQVEDVDYFFGENKIVWIRLKNGRKYVVDYTLEELEDLLDPQMFFRINRKYLTTFNAISEVIAYTNSRLKVILKSPPDTDDVIISREKAEDFRIWLGK